CSSPDTKNGRCAAASAAATWSTIARSRAGSPARRAARSSGSGLSLTASSAGISGNSAPAIPWDSAMGRGRAGGRRSPGPGQDGEAWPLLAPPRGLLLVDVTGREHRVGTHHQVEHVGKPVRGVDTPSPAGLHADAEA